MRLEHRPKKSYAAPIDGQSKTDHGEPGKYSDKYGQQQKETILTESGLERGAGGEAAGPVASGLRSGGGK